MKQPPTPSPTDPLFRYSPSAASEQSLEFVFVGRDHLVQACLDSVADLRASHGAAHHLFIGDRGMGKSHLVSMIAARIRVHYPATEVIVARLDEEAWLVRDYASLLSEVLARTSQTRELGSKLDPKMLEDQLVTLAHDTPLVVVLEHLDEIFERLGFDGRTRLRALLENSGRIALLATATERPAFISRHSEPFFGFFDVSDLLPLAPVEVVELVQRVARYCGHHEVARLAETARGQRTLHAVHALLGGQPRMWTILAELANPAALTEPAGWVKRAVDDLLPQYQDRVGALPRDQQAIVMCLVEAGGALTVKSIAEQVQADPRSVSGQLRHLGSKGWVGPAAPLTVPAEGDRRATYYELREPLVRICLQMRNGRGVPIAAALSYLLGDRSAAEPAGSIARAVTAFNNDRNRAHLMSLPLEWRMEAQKQVSNEVTSSQ